MWEYTGSPISPCDVIVADDACATRDLTGADGTTVPHQVLHQASLATLGDAFADVQTTDAILKPSTRSGSGSGP